MMNFNLENLSEIIDEVLVEFCTMYPIPNFDNKEQLEYLRSVLEQFGAENLTDEQLMEAISLAPKKFTLEAPTKKAGGKNIDKILQQKIKNTDTGRDITVASALNYKDQKGAGARRAYHQAVGMLQAAGFSEKDVDMVDDPNPEEPQYYAKQKPEEKPKAEPQQKQTQPKGQSLAANVPIEKPKAEEPSKYKNMMDALINSGKQKPEKQAQVIKQKTLAIVKEVSTSAKASALRYSKWLKANGIRPDGKKYPKPAAGNFYLEKNFGKGDYIAIPGKDVANAIKKVMGGQPLDANDKKLLNATTKFVSGGNGDVKVYISRKAVGRHMQAGYGGVELAKGNPTMADELRKVSMKLGLNSGRTSEGAIGKKVYTPAKAAQALAKMAKTQPTENLQVQDVKAANGKMGVTLGDQKLLPIDDVKLEDIQRDLIKQGMKPEEAKKEANIVYTEILAYNSKLNDIRVAGSKGKPPGTIPMNNFGDVKSPDGRNQAISNIANGLSISFKQELAEYGAKFGKTDIEQKPENQAIFKTLDEIAALTQKGKIEQNPQLQQAYKAKLDELMLNLTNAPDFQDAAADLAEMKVGLMYLGQGKQVYFPAAENFATADIIVIPDKPSITPKKGQSLSEAIAQNLQLTKVTFEIVGGVSVKFKGGGGSAGPDKIRSTVYKHGKQMQTALLKAQENLYKLAYPDDKNKQIHLSDKDIKNGYNELKELEDYLLSIKPPFLNKQQLETIRKIGISQAKKAYNGAFKDVGKCKGANRKNFEKALEIHHVMQHLTAYANNEDVLYTSFANVNEKVSVNKDGIATKCEDDIADGVRPPCYMSPLHNPGFTAIDSGDGCMTASTNNTNPSHIKSSKPDLLHFKEED